MIIAKYLGVNNRYISCPFWLAYAGAWVLYVLSFGKLDMREKVQRMVEPRAYDHDKATRDFGYAPVCFEEGIKDEIEQFKEYVSK